MPMPNGHLWTEFLEPLAGQTVSADLFGRPAFKDIHYLREQFIFPSYLDTGSADVIPGDVVTQIGGTGLAWKVTKTTTLAQVGMLGVMIDPASHLDGLIHQAQFGGVVEVNVHGGAVTGDWLRCSATAGAVEVCAATDPGACMQALTDSTVMGGGQVTALLHPTLAAGMSTGGGGGGGGGGGSGAGFYTFTVPVLADGWTVFNNPASPNDCVTAQDSDSGIIIADSLNGISDPNWAAWRGISLPITWPLATNVPYYFAVQYPGFPFDTPADGPFVGACLTDGTKVAGLWIRYNDTPSGAPYDHRFYAHSVSAANIDGTSTAIIGATVARWISTEPFGLIRLTHVGSGLVHAQVSGDGGLMWHSTADIDVSAGGLNFTPTAICVLLRAKNAAYAIVTRFRHYATTPPS